MSSTCALPRTLVEKLYHSSERVQRTAGKVLGGRVRLVLDDDLALQAGAVSGRRVAGHQRADEVVPPLVVAAHVGGVVDGHDAAAGALILLQRRLLGGGPGITGGLEHHQRVEARQVGVVEDRRVLGVLGGHAGLLERGAQQRRAVVDRVGVTERRGLGEDEDVGRSRLLHALQGRLVDAPLRRVGGEQHAGADLGRGMRVRSADVVSFRRATEGNGTRHGQRGSPSRAPSQTPHRHSSGFDYKPAGRVPDVSAKSTTFVRLSADRYSASESSSRKSATSLSQRSETKLT